MRHAAPAPLLGSLLLLGAANAFGLGLGRVSTLSYLGNPLELSVGVSAEVSDGLTPDCVNAEVFVGDHRLASELVRIRINRAPDGTPISLRLVTGARIDEPVATVTLMLGCPTSVTRRYVVFIDPPSVNLAQAESVDTTATGPSEAPSVMRIAPAPGRVPSARKRAPAAVTAAATDLSDSTVASSARRPTEPRIVDEEGTRVALPARKPRRSASTAAAASTPAVATAAVAGSRLRLESAPAGQTGSPAREQTASSARAVPSAGASASGIAELTTQVNANSLALDQARLRALEDRFNRLRTDNEATKRTLAELQAGLKAAQGERFDKWLVYGLAAAVALLLLGLLAALLRLRSRRGAASWSEGDDADADGPVVVREPSAAGGKPVQATSDRLTDYLGPDPVVEQRDASWQTSSPSLLASVAVASQAPRPAPAPSSDAADPNAVERHSLDQPQTMPGPVYGVAANAAAAAGHGASIDELVDLDQQAEFFVVLGQDDAAIDLLTGHVQTTGDASPLPYLKLLEIYRRRGEQTAYSRTRERFNRRFGATAPDWEDESQAGRSIEEHAQVMGRLQAVWPEPSAAMQLLESLLFRRDPSVPEFDLQAYGELLFLYSIARDLAERVVPHDEVDLLLPLDGDSPPVPSLGFALGLGAPTETAARSEAAVPVDFNLDLLDAPIVPASIAASTELPDAPPVVPAHHR